MAGFLDDPSIINNGAANAVQSSAPPYMPFGQFVGVDPYNFQPNIGSNISYENMFGNAFNPQYANPNEMQTYTSIGNSPDQEMNYHNIGSMYDTAAQGNAYTVGNPYWFDSSRYNATQGTAQQGEVDPNSMIQNQMDTLLHSDTNANGTPEWAQPAVTASNQRMNSLGLGASTMAGNAQTTAILNAAMPMAAANAQVVAQLNSQNLSNRQQMMISNTAWDNAAKQFNAQSEQQNNQFFSTLTAQIATQNADRLTSMSQFNTGQTNAMRQFVDNLNSQREEFNTSNQILVDQSNVQWRRAINVANTAGINSVNQTNAQNMFNLSTMDQNNLWQQARDEASWALTSGENSKNRMLSLVNSALNRSTSLQILSSTLNANMFSQLGAFGVNLLGGSFGTGLTNSLFGSSTGTNNNLISQDFGGGSGPDFIPSLSEG